MHGVSTLTLHTCRHAVAWVPLLANEAHPASQQWADGTDLKDNCIRLAHNL